MPRLMKPGVLAGCLALALSAALPAHAEGELKVTLDAKRVVTAHGKETFVPAAKARPGDVIQYQATYRLPGASGVRQVLATLPIPKGMEYVARSAEPARVEASVDGRSYAPVPLRRAVRLDDGREVMREVPVTEYRYLRWSLGDLEGRGQESVKARVRVAPADLSGATAR